MVFDHAYVLRWRRHTDEGTGWNQAAELTFADGVAHGGGNAAETLNLECNTVQTGWLFTPDDRWEHVIPAPLQIDRDPVVLVAFSIHGERLLVAGKAASLTLVGDAKYVEDNWRGIPQPKSSPRPHADSGARQDDVGTLQRLLRKVLSYLP